MTENKRFTIEPTTIGECIVDNTTGEQLDTSDYTERLCELLNELNDENEQLRFDFKQMKELLHSLEDEIKKLEKENKELKYHLNRTEKELEEYKEFMSLG